MTRRITQRLVRRSWLCAGLFASWFVSASVAGALVPAVLGAQSILKGVVLTDVTETPIAGAEIVFPQLGLSVKSDSTGKFRIAAIPAGNHLVIVRHLRYSPAQTVLTFAGGDSIDTDMLLTAAKTVLPTVEVATEKVPTGKLAAFDERRRAGIGRFLSATDLEKFDGRRVSDALSTLPGNQILQGNSMVAWVYGGRGVQSRSGGGSSLDRMDIARGAKPGYCYAAVVVDGAFVYQGLPGEALFDINSIPIQNIAGVESYVGAATMPAMYNGTRRTCGLIVLWTK